MGAHYRRSGGIQSFVMSAQTVNDGKTSVTIVLIVQS